ncbi:hypothetical protein HNQ92_001110 [Rhabdobacter roseus]|uniref:Uncharacterized protein n=1 Tax=Rhabdobacter roseus TaxID=1655419 RepID=A0A840THP2_9BACT|nr:hypothetical protein [Rhabdobacter roseus]MBB5282984.1 hypothetical protein [Rhabdobacter roseus]
MKQLSPEWVRDFLRQKGREITVEEAAMIYEWLRKVAFLAVGHYLRT